MNISLINHVSKSSDKSTTNILSLSKHQMARKMHHAHTLHLEQVDTLLLLRSEGLPLTQKSYREAKRECFQTKLTFPNGFSGLPSLKGTPFVVTHSEFPDYFSISNSPFIFSGQWKRWAEQSKSLIQLEHFHLLSRRCFTISEYHLIFIPNISINLTAGMLWLLISEGKTCLKKGIKEAFFSCHPHQWQNSFERVCPWHKEPGEICSCLFTQYGVQTSSWLSGQNQTEGRKRLVSYRQTQCHSLQARWFASLWTQVPCWATVLTCSGLKPHNCLTNFRLETPHILLWTLAVYRYYTLIGLYMWKLWTLSSYIVWAKNEITLQYTVYQSSEQYTLLKS